MNTLKAQTEECVKKIVERRNKAERERYKKAVNYVREKLQSKILSATTQCDNLLEKIADIACAKERENNVAAYHKAVRTRDAFRESLEIVSDAPGFHPPVQETETWDSDIYGDIGMLVCSIADQTRADEKARRRTITKRLRSRAAAKKSIKRK